MGNRCERLTEGLAEGSAVNDTGDEQWKYTKSKQEMN